ncbi:MAG: VCBS repeat-containing protein [Planctomycetes bacterium]|nr:VCBS repeat-containing protein [Planctomycetota bacterium]
MNTRHVLALLVGCSALVAQQFAPSGGRQPAEIPPRPWSVIALADCDGDGDQDAVGNDPQGQFVILRQGPAGVWTTIDLLPNVVTAATWADFDGDGDLDVLVGATSLYVGAPFGIARNDGASFTWLFQSPSVLVGTVLECHAADLDGDQALDSVCGVTSGVQINRNLGNAVLGPATVVTNLPNARPALFDRDADGDLDLVVASTGGVRLFDNNAGVFTPIAAFAAVGTDVAAGDLDGDGRTDLVLANAGTVDVLWNQPAGFVLAAAVVPAGAPSREVALADLDRDGDLDVAVRSIESVDWIRNDGNGVFVRQAGVTLGSPWQVTAWAIGDGAARGAADVVAVFHDGQVRTLYGASPQPFLDPQALPKLPLGITIVGDVDNDGRPDLVVPVAREVVHDDGRGRYSRRTIAGANPNFGNGCLADFDGDGDLDLLLGSPTQPVPPVPPMQRFANDGFGNFSPVQNVAVPWTYQRYRPGDVDGDGDVDLLTPNGNFLDLFASTGNGVLAHLGQVPGVPPMEIVNDVVFADLDGDGDRDIVGGQLQGTLPVYRNDGTGTFSVGGTVQLLPGVYAWAIAGGDIDGDGAPDLVVSESGTLSWFRNLGANGFARVLGVFPPGAGFGSFALVDVDEDGDLDVWTSHYAIKLLRNDGAGVFQDATADVAPQALNPTVFLDFDEDGDIDTLVPQAPGGVVARVANRMRGAESVHAPRPGGSMQVRFFAQPHAPDPNTLVLSIAALSQGPAVPVPGHVGKLLLPIGGIVALELVLAPTGTSTTTIAVPTAASLIGLEVCVQGVVVTSTSLGFTNVVDERILP